MAATRRRRRAVGTGPTQGGVPHHEHTRQARHVRDRRHRRRSSRSSRSAVRCSRSRSCSCCWRGSSPRCCASARRGSSHGFWWKLDAERRRRPRGRGRCSSAVRGRSRGATRCPASSAWWSGMFVVRRPRSVMIVGGLLSGDRAGGVTATPQPLTRFGGRSPASTATAPSLASCAMRRRVASVALPMCGSSTACGAASSRGMHLGFALVDVDPRGEDRAVLERDGQRLLVDHRAAGRVHQHRGPLHQPESTRVDQAARLVVQRHVQRHDVGARQQVVEVRTHPVMPVSVRVWCSTSMPNPAARRATARPMRPYPTIPRVAPCTSTPRKSPMWKPVQRPARRSASASDARRHAARMRRNARSAVVSSSTPGVLHTAMPSSAAVGDVDVVVAHRDVGDDPQPRARRPRSTARVDAVGQDADDRVDLGGQRHQLVGGVGLVTGALHELVAGGDERVEPALGQLAGDEDAGHGAASVDGTCPTRCQPDVRNVRFADSRYSGGDRGRRVPMRRAEPNRDDVFDLREVVVEHRADIFRYARSFCRNDADAEDLAQNAVRARARRGRRGAQPRAGQVVPAADRAQPRHRPGARPGPRAGGAVRRRPRRGVRAIPRPTPASCTTTSTSSRAPRSPTCRASTRRCCTSGSSRSSTTTAIAARLQTHRAGRSPARLPRHAGPARDHPAAPARPRQPLDAFRRRNRRDMHGVAAPKADGCEVSRRGVPGHPSPPRGGGGGRGHGPRSGGRAPG